MLERKSLMHLMMNLQQGINYQDFIVRSELKEVKKFFLTQQLSEFGGFFSRESGDIVDIADQWWNHLKPAVYRHLLLILECMWTQIEISKKWCPFNMFNVQGHFHIHAAKNNVAISGTDHLVNVVKAIRPQCVLTASWVHSLLYSEMSTDQITQNVFMPGVNRA